jgi:hypothetical protein
MMGLVVLLSLWIVYVVVQLFPSAPCLYRPSDELTITKLVSPLYDSIIHHVAFDIRAAVALVIPIGTGQFAARCCQICHKHSMYVSHCRTRNKLQLHK